MTNINNPICATCKHGRSKLRDNADVPAGKIVCRFNPPTTQLFPLVAVALLPFALKQDKLPLDAPQELKDAVAALEGRAVFYPVMVHSPVVDPEYGCGQWAPRIERLN